MTLSLRNLLNGRSRAFFIGSAAVLVAAIASADLVTGYQVSVGLLYVVPVALMAWYVSRLASAAVAMISALTWYAVSAFNAPEEVGTPILAWNGAIRLGLFILISILMSSLKEAYDHQRRLARTDPLTGLLNGRAFEEEARLELMRAQRLNYEVGVLYIDLDNFKRLNDSRGHAAGDLFLKDMGTVLKSKLRATDVIGRLGGDEFGVILAATSRPQVLAIATRLQEALAHLSATAQPPVTLTIGGVTSDGSEDIDTLIGRADNIMYRAKATGKGSIQLSSAGEH